MNRTSTQIELPELIREHEDLVLRLKAERMWWQQLREMGKPNFGQMGTRLEELRNRLADHFAHEESAELAAGAASPATPIAPNSAKHHREFLARLDQIIGQLGGCGPGFNCWGAAGQEFELFAMDLQLDQEAELRELRSSLDDQH
jgi:hypothetical protein